MIKKLDKKIAFRIDFCFYKYEMIMRTAWKEEYIKIAWPEAFREL